MTPSPPGTHLPRFQWLDVASRMRTSCPPAQQTRWPLCDRTRGVRGAVPRLSSELKYFDVNVGPRVAQRKSLAREMLAQRTTVQAGEDYEDGVSSVSAGTPK